MKKLLILMILFCGQTVMGQRPPDLKSHYKGGDNAFYKLFATQLKYIDRYAVGTIIVSWKVDNGKVRDASILNSLGYKTDEEVLRVLELTEKNWISTDSSAQFFLPIKFKPNELNFFVDDYPDNFLEELVMVSYSTNDNKEYRTDDFLVTKLNGFLTEKKFKKGIRILDQLIMRNPINQQLRETRIYSLNLLKKFEPACQDVKFIENYLGSVSKYPCIENR